MFITKKYQIMHSEFNLCNASSIIMDWASLISTYINLLQFARNFLYNISSFIYLIMQIILIVRNIILCNFTLRELFMLDMYIFMITQKVGLDYKLSLNITCIIRAFIQRYIIHLKDIFTYMCMEYVSSICIYTAYFTYPLICINMTWKFKTHFV